MNNKPKLRQTKCFFIMCMSAERAEIYGQLLQYTATYNTTFQMVICTVLQNQKLPNCRCFQQALLPVMLCFLFSQFTQHYNQ